MHDFSGLLLLIPDKPDPERDSVAAAWRESGGEVLRLGRFWTPPAVDRARTRVYGPEVFCLVLAEKLQLELVSPADDIIRTVPYELLRRRAAIQSLGEVLDSAYPLFSKPVIPKQFSGRVYTSRTDLEQETRGIPRDTAVLQSEVVQIEAEARAFILDGRALTISVYEGEASAPERFVENLASRTSIPQTCVLDVGLVPREGWVFLEANASWGAGLNGCDARLALPSIEKASRPR